LLAILSIALCSLLFAAGDASLRQLEALVLEKSLFSGFDHERCTAQTCSLFVLHDLFLVD